jgi:pentatricopeptide repeat protein
MLDGFKNFTLLGKGGFGKVFLAEEEISGKKVAIKQLYSNLLTNRDFVLNEIRTISSFNHPNIVQYKVAFVKGNDLFFVMEYCPGGSLASAIKNQNISFNKAIETTLAIAKTLHIVNSNNFIHNDIKPENIFFGDNGIVKIGDFGVANSNIGTIKYLPPQKLFDTIENASFHRDIFALGITFIELLNNERLFLGLTSDQRADKIISCDLGIKKYPLWVQEIILKMISVNPEYRFKTMAEVASAIETRNIPFVIDDESLKAAEQAKKLSSLLKRKKYYTLQKSIESLKSTFKNHSSVLEILGKYYLDINKYNLAKKIFLALKEKIPSVNINKELGIIFLETNQIAQAIRHLTEYLLLHPADYEAYNLLLESYFRSGRYDDGLKLSDQLRRLLPNESCFKINCDLFFFMLNQNNKNLIESYLPSSGKDNLLIAYNRWVIIHKDEVLNTNNVLSDKLVFCNYSLTKHGYINNKYQILVNGTEFSFKNKGVITIGRTGFNNDIEFADNNVSRKQAILFMSVTESWIYELGGVKIYVDDEVVNKKKRLYYRHEIRFAKHTMVINVDRTKLF